MYYNTGYGNIYYEKKGEGPGVLFLHGLGGSLDSMYPLSNSLKNYTKIYVDLPCHGKSDDFEISFIDLAKSLVSLMEYLGFKKFYVVGISLGSLVAETIAINFQEHIAKAAFISPATNIDEQSIRIVFDWFSSEEGAAKSLFSKEFYETHKEEIMEYEKNHPLYPERLSNIVNEIMTFNIIDKKSSVNCIIIYGEYDNLFGERMNNALKKIFRNCSIFKLKTGHAIHRESPLEAEKIIYKFFNNG